MPNNPRTPEEKEIQAFLAHLERAAENLSKETQPLKKTPEEEEETWEEIGFQGKQDKGKTIPLNTLARQALQSAEKAFDKLQKAVEQNKKKGTPVSPSITKAAEEVADSTKAVLNHPDVKKLSSKIQRQLEKLWEGFKSLLSSILKYKPKKASEESRPLITNQFRLKKSDTRGKPRGDVPENWKHPKPPH